MDWINKHVNQDLFTSYDEKYGNEAYWDWQKAMFEYPEIVNALKVLTKTIETPVNILDIGINNAYEFRALKTVSESNWDWSIVSVTGIDLSQSALKIARTTLESLNIKHELLNKDITQVTDFAGNFDLCIAITSLQSAVIYDRYFFNFMNRLLEFMAPTSTFFIIVPNCAVQDGKVQQGGAFNVRLGRQDPEFAGKFINDCARILSNRNYKNKIMGHDFISLISQRIE